jgi:ParB/RepB/Spo0J family partition protein
MAMSVQHFPLAQIDPNPFQTRAGEDPAHIKQLALSIIYQGLLQIPIGRQVGERVQLAFGHSRLAAYRWIVDVQPTSNVEGDFSTFPVAIRELNDQEMFVLAVRENNDRKDISPIEQARAMLTYREHFGKTSTEIGALFGLSDSAVRNKIRLLSLPEDVQAQAGQISERVLREILTLFDLPACVRERGEGDGWREIKPSGIVRDALGGKTADTIHERVERLVINESTNMSDAPWKFDKVFDHPEVIGICKTCEFRFMHGGANRCANEACYKLKEQLVKLEYLQAASAVCGIPVAEDMAKSAYQYNDIGYSDERTSAILKAGCENLRLVYDRKATWESDRDRVEGYPDAEIRCSKRQGFCTCMKALESGVHLDRKYQTVTDPETGTERVVENPAPEPLTAKDLKEIARETSRQKRQNLEECKAIREEAARAIASGLKAGNPIILHKVFQQLGWNAKSLEDQIDIENDYQGSAEIVRLAIGLFVAEKIYSWEYSDPVPERAVKAFNELFGKARMRLMVDVSTETEG